MKCRASECRKKLVSIMPSAADVLVTKKWRMAFEAIRH